MRIFINPHFFESTASQGFAVDSKLSPACFREGSHNTATYSPLTTYRWFQYAPMYVFFFFFFFFFTIYTHIYIYIYMIYVLYIYIYMYYIYIYNYLSIYVYTLIYSSFGSRKWRCAARNLRRLVSLGFAALGVYVYIPRSSKLLNSK